GEAEWLELGETGRSGAVRGMWHAESHDRRQALAERSDQELLGIARPEQVLGERGDERAQRQERDAPERLLRGPRHVRATRRGQYQRDGDAAERAQVRRRGGRRDEDEERAQRTEQRDAHPRSIDR